MYLLVQGQTLSMAVGSLIYLFASDVLCLDLFSFFLILKEPRAITQINVCISISSLYHKNIKSNLLYMKHFRYAHSLTEDWKVKSLKGPGGSMS